MSVYVFPGQGSQSKGMGGSLFDEFKELVSQADQILGYSIKNLCMEDRDAQLGQTQYTQPALYTVNALSYLKKIQEEGKKPDFAAGHSLGEYNALFAAGAFDFATGLRLVKKRGELMSHALGGGMAAIIGLNEEQVSTVLAENNLQSIDLANFNSPTQIVISGLKADIVKAQPIFEQIKGVQMFVVLKTSGAFHSRYMKASQEEFAVFLNDFKFSNLIVPVISNVYARPYRQGDVKKNLIEQITRPVKWTESIRYLMGLSETEFFEIGPGNVLTGLIRRIKKEAEPLVIEKENLAVQIETEDPKALIVNNKEESLIKETKKSDRITPSMLGNMEFKQDYNLKYAYVTGGMYRGVASPEMVVKMGKAGMMGFLGTGGLESEKIEAGINYIQSELNEGQAYGLNLLHTPNNPEAEERNVDLFLKYGVRKIEASAFMGITPALVKYRVQGLKLDQEKKVITTNKIMAKLSRPEVAEAFLSPAPERLINKLLQENKITEAQAQLAKTVAMADDICVEADSGGHTDSGVAYALMPAMIKLRDEMMKKYQYHKRIRIGAAGGIGTPEAAAAAYMLGADFILTGSINQCTVEAATSDTVKELLQQMNVQDTDYAPAGDMFELGAKVQVLKKGVFFPARANKLYELYRQYNSLSEIDEKVKQQIQEKYFKRSFEEVYDEIKAYYPAQEVQKAEQNPKHKMALIFRWYFGYSSRLALSGSEESRVDFQVHSGPALGAFNQWVKGTELENWRNRHVDIIAEKLMVEVAELLNQRYRTLLGA